MANTRALLLFLFLDVTALLGNIQWPKFRPMLIVFFFLNVGPAADGISISSPFDPSVAQLEITTIPAVVWK